MIEEEDQQIVAYMLSMCERGFVLVPFVLKLKVFEITKHKVMRLKYGTLGDG